MTDQEHSRSPSRQFGISKVHFCPDCRKPMRRIDGKLGPFWGCTGFPECHATLNDVDGKPSREPDEHYRCPVCTRRMVKTQTGSGDVYWNCTGADRGCNVRLKDDHGRPETAYRCASCGHLLVKRHGKHGAFWGCSAYPDCRQTYNDSNGLPDFKKP